MAVYMRSFQIERLSCVFRTCSSNSWQPFWVKTFPEEMYIGSGTWKDKTEDAIVGGPNHPHSLAALARSISDTNNECENSVQAPCPWSNLFISYLLSEHFLFLFRKTSLYLEKMTSEFKKQEPAQTKCPKKYIIRWSLQMLWVKILTKNWSKMKYNLLTQDCLRWLHY